MAMRGHNASVLFALAAMVWSPAASSAQNARVVTANSSDGQILEITFDPPGSTVLNTDASSRDDLVSLVFRDDGAAGVHLLAADREKGQVVFYTDVAGEGAIVLDADTPTHPPFPDGLSLDAEQNLFGTSSASDAEEDDDEDEDALVWVLLRDPFCVDACLPGGYDPSVGTLDGSIEITVSIGGIPTVLEVETLTQTRVVPFDVGVLQAGDLLVLASDPAVLLRYPAASVEAFLVALAQGETPAEIEPQVFIFPSMADAPPEQRFPDRAEPNGMDFTPQGNLLVSLGEGTILIYRPDGTRLSDSRGFVDFAAGLGEGTFKLAVGLQDAVFRAFVARSEEDDDDGDDAEASDDDEGEVLRFRIEPDGTGTLDGVVADLGFPVAIATTTASAVPVPAGVDITIQATNLMETTIENVLVAGAVGVSVLLFEDPRESEVSIPSNLPLHRSLFLSEIRSDLPPDAEIPDYVRAFRKDDPLLGPPTFLLIVADTSAEVLGVLSHVVEEELILGYEPDCDDPDVTAQPRLFWVPSSSEPPILESPMFIDVTNGCGTSRGLTRSWSLFLASARDTRPTRGIASTKLLALSTVLDQSVCVETNLARSLRRRLNFVLRQFALRRYQTAIDGLNAFTAQILASPNGFVNCTGNESGELRARADSAIFFLQKLVVSPPPTPPPLDPASPETPSSLRGAAPRSEDGVARPLRDRALFSFPATLSTQRELAPKRNDLLPHR